MQNETCPDCGAIFTEGLTCESVFDQFLVLEFSNPAYGAVHMLTVACFMIQHGRYSPQGLAWIAGALRDHLELGISSQEIRSEAVKTVDPAIRDWKVTRRPGDPPQAKVAWSMSILDVALNYEDAASYCEWVKRWARITLDEMQPLLSSR